MILLALGKDNKVGVKVSATDGLSGFSISLFACGTKKSGITNDQGEVSFVFSADEVVNVTRDHVGDYGTLIITDAEGTQRLKAIPCFRAVEDAFSTTDRDRTLFLTVTEPMNMPSGGGGDIDLSAYATKKDLKQSSDENKQYTDDKISDIGETIISEQLVTVHGEDGAQRQITVQQAVQDVVDMQTQVTGLVRNNVSWEVKDEDEDGQPDGEALYFYKGKA